MQRMVDGELVDMTADEIAARNAEVAAELALQPQQLIKQQIQALEAQITDRRIREAILGSDSGWLRDINNQIAALRAQLT